MGFKWLRVLIQLFVGIAIILWLLQLSDIRKVLSLILMINPLSVILASAFFIIASTFTALALYVSIKPIEDSAPMGKIILGSFAGQLLSDVTPARSGYFATPLILKELCSVSIEKGVIGVLTTGIINSFTKVILSVIALIYFIRFLPLDLMIINSLVIGILFFLGGGILLLIVLMENRVLKFATFLERMPVIKDVAIKLIEMLSKIQEGGMSIKKHFPKISVLVLLSLVSNATALQFISEGLDFRSLTLLEFIFVAALVTSLMYVPATIAGLGVQETGYFLLLTLLGMPPEGAVSFALIARILFTGTDIIGLPTLIKVSFKAR